jgi:hypothetical protein
MRRGLARQTFCRIFAEASLAGADGGFDDAGAHIDRMPLELDEQGRREVSDVLTGVLEQVHEIQQRADARPRHPGRSRRRPDRDEHGASALPGLGPTGPESAGERTSTEASAAA